MSNNVHHVLSLLSCKLKYSYNKNNATVEMPLILSLVSNSSHLFEISDVSLQTRLVFQIHYIHYSYTIYQNCHTFQNYHISIKCIALKPVTLSYIIIRDGKNFKRGICTYIRSEKLVQSLLELKSLSVSQLERSGWDNITAPAREGFNFWGKTQINSLNDDEVHTSYLSFCTQPQFDAKKINA